MKRQSKSKQVIKWAKDTVAGKIIAGQDRINACQRFLNDLERDDLEFRTGYADAAVSIMEGLFVHRTGESLDGTPLLGTPFILSDWELFCTYNLLGFYKKGTEERRYKEAFIQVPRKAGKALALDTEIPTPAGWRKMGDLREGDFVFGEDGKPARITTTSEIFNKPMYRVEFEDGASVLASSDHLWTVQTKDSRRTARRPVKVHNWWYKPELRETDGWYTVCTEDMVCDYVHMRADGKGCEHKYRVPMCAPVEYPEKELPVDPYVLGVWLGDGTSSSTTITCSNADKDEMMQNVEACGHTCKWYQHKKRAGGFGIDIGSKGKNNPLRDKLRAIGVFENKHIPEIYLQSSIEQRLALLQGLMDTDGTCSKKGMCEFSQKNRALSEQVLELTASLGIKAKIKAKRAVLNGMDVGITHRVTFYTDKTRPCFRLERKYKRLKDHLANRMNAKSIVRIERVGSVPSRCIAVDSPRHLFLFGRNYTTTHNTSFVAALSFAVSVIQRRSGSTVYVVAASTKQALESFKFIKFSLEYKRVAAMMDVHDNTFEHSIKYTFTKDGRPDGFIDIQVMASNPDAQDSFNCNFAIADEVAAYRKPAQYNRFKEAMQSHTNKLMVGITTAGDNMNSFGYNRMEYAIKVASGAVKDDTLFSFVCRADQDEKGNVDYTDEIQHRKANPSWGITIRPADMMQAALQAQNDPQQRKDFLSRSLNIYTAAMSAWFDIEEFKASDSQYNWTISELAKLPIDWYGGADLSRMYDLTAVALFGQYNGVDIIITHAFFPVTQAAAKADEDNIPIFGWADDGNLTMCNGKTVNMAEVVKWFEDMRARGFKIRQVGHDRKFAGEEYFPMMKAAHFTVVDQPQLYFLKSRGFRHIEKAAKDGKLYYLHSSAYEYCVSNVKAIEKVDDAVQYEKINPKHRIDLFDASVFACIRCLEAQEKRKKARSWFGEDKDE